MPVVAVAVDTAAGTAVVAAVPVVAVVVPASLAVFDSYHKTLLQRLPECHTWDTDTPAVSYTPFLPYLNLAGARAQRQPSC